MIQSLSNNAVQSIEGPPVGKFVPLNCRPIREAVAAFLSIDSDQNPRLWFRVSDNLASALRLEELNGDAQISNRSLLQCIAADVKKPGSSSVDFYSALSKEAKAGIRQLTGSGVAQERACRAFDKLLASCSETEKSEEISSSVTVECISRHDVQVAVGKRVLPHRLANLQQEMDELLRRFEIRAAFRPESDGSSLKKIARVKKELAEYLDIHEKLSRGYTLAQISEETGIGITRVQHWSKGENPWSFQSLREMVTDSREKSEMRTPEECPLAWATFLGAYCASSRGAMASTIRISKGDREARDPVASALTEILGDRGWAADQRIKDGNTYFEVRINQSAFRELVFKVTKFGGTVPLGLLNGPDERRNFLASFFSHVGTVDAGGFRVPLKKNPEFIVQIGELCRTFGIIPGIELGKKSYLTITNGADLETALESGLITTSSMQSRLRAEVQKKQSSKRTSHSVDTYQRAKSLLDGGSSVTEIGKELGLPPQMVRRWVVDDKPPVSVLRERQLESLRIQYGVPSAEELIIRSRASSNLVGREIAELESGAMRAAAELLASKGGLIETTGRITGELKSSMWKLEASPVLPPPPTKYIFGSLLRFAESFGGTPATFDECCWEIALAHRDAVVSQAKIFVQRNRWILREVDSQEVEGIALQAAFNAARRFDPDRGIKFQTFANKRVCGALVDTFTERTRSAIDCIGIDHAIAPTVSSERSPSELVAEHDAVMDLLEPFSAKVRYLMSARHMHGRTIEELGTSISVSPSRISQQISAKAISALQSRVLEENHPDKM
ncbi:MAG: sigma-70 family RNA polymerase sigma factor, partial [Bdellovibrionales bacterium]|nr:sigma-70 family RNA polymerase sigma factor [Bdellovibrionales bacterium]